MLAVLRESPAGAQQTGKTYRVGILSGRAPEDDRMNLDAFRRSLSGLGYQERKNLDIVYRSASGDSERYPELAADLVRAKLDVIVAQGTPAIAAAKRATTSVPIVMTNSSEPVGFGFIVSLARPGGNITGPANMDVELIGKRLQLLKELVPRLRRVAVIGNPSDVANLAGWREAESDARRLGMTAVAVEIRSSDQIDAAVKTLPHLRADAIVVLPDTVMLSNAVRIVRLVAAQKLPAVYQNSSYTAAGGLMFYGPSEIATWSRAATYVDRILKGAKPADLPVERPTTFELIVNLKAARDIGITVPQSILLRADQVIR